MKKILTVLLASGFILFSSLNVYAYKQGNCTYHWQYAKDGSRCGDRAADRR